MICSQSRRRLKKPYVFITLFFLDKKKNISSFSKTAIISKKIKQIKIRIKPMKTTIEHFSPGFRVKEQVNITSIWMDLILILWVVKHKAPAQIPDTERNKNNKQMRYVALLLIYWISANEWTCFSFLHLLFSSFFYWIRTLQHKPLETISLYVWNFLMKCFFFFYFIFIFFAGWNGKWMMNERMSKWMNEWMTLILFETKSATTERNEVLSEQTATTTTTTARLYWKWRSIENVTLPWLCSASPNVSLIN